MSNATQQMQAAFGIGSTIIFGRDREPGVDGVDHKSRNPYELVQLTGNGPKFICGCEELAMAQQIRHALTLLSGVV